MVDVLADAIVGAVFGVGVSEWFRTLVSGNGEKGENHVWGATLDC